MSDYWEARDILREMIRINSRYAVPLCMQVYRDRNGIGAIAAKYLWRNKGEAYGKEFMGYAKTYGDNEAFYTFINELVDIYQRNEVEAYADIDDLKEQFKKQAITILSGANNCNAITTKVLIYMGFGEQDWFADNWIKLYKTFKSSRCDDVGAGFNVALANNRKVRNSMNELKSIISEDDYWILEKVIKQHEAVEAYREKNPINKQEQ